MFKEGCIICGSKIEYSAEASERVCEFCGKGFSSNAACSKGHYICDSCHSEGAVPVIKKICMETSSVRPREIALQIMESPAVHMHGPEHHIIIGAALAAAYKNAGGAVDLCNTLEIITARGKNVPGGICGNWGVCGAAAGAGIFLSAVLSASPMSVESYGLCNLLASDCLKAVGLIGGPRCCKRNVGLAINTAVDFVKDKLGVTMEKDESHCGFVERNKECIARRCPFFKTAG